MQASLRHQLADTEIASRSRAPQLQAERQRRVAGNLARAPRRI